MKNPLKSSRRPRRGGGLHSQTQARNHHITKSGNKISLNRNLAQRFKAKKDARQRKRAAYLATLPKGRIQRTLYRLHPRRVAKYWFSREGGIMALKIAGIGTLATFLLLLGIFAYFRKDLPNLRDISGNNIGGSIRYYDRTGQTLLWEDYDAVKRTPVRDEGQAQVLKDATVAIEDKDFFNHGGFDVRGITRAGVNNLLGKSSTQGGSTITQQLVKLTQNWSRDRSYTRKVKELILSVELERTYSKKEILAGYLDTAPYGDITYGVEAAMRDYFQKSAKDATLDEAAFLAAIPKSPTIYSPYGARFSKEALIGRQHYVLDLMAEQGKITTKQRDEAKKNDTVAKIKPRQPKYEGIKAPWFVLAAKESLQAKFTAETVQRGGWKVTTTLDLGKQQIAEEELNEGMRQVRRQGGDTGALVSEDVQTGQVVALVGGSDFSNQEYGQNNYARLKLPPGSTFKPYDYLSVIENTDQFGAGTVLYDVLEPIDGYPCTNKARKSPPGDCLQDFDFRNPGPLTLRYSLGGSRNIPAVKAMLIAGADKTIGTAEKIGLKDSGDDRIEGQGYKCYQEGDESLTKEAPCGGSAAIGDGAYLKLDEHVHAYSTISRNGKLIPHTYILKIEDASNKMVDEWKQTEGKQAVRDEAAYIVADMMEDPRASYFQSKIHRYNGHKFAIKTGTTNDSKDGWLMGFSTQYATGVWVGEHQRQKEMSGFMENMTRPIWNGYMTRIHKDLKPIERQRPAGIKTLPAFVVRTHVGVGSQEPSPSTDLFPSWYQAKKKSNGNQTIDIVSNKIATDCTPGRARQNARNANANEFSADRFHGGGGRAASNTTEKDDVHKCEDAKPSITLTVPANCNISCDFTATVTGGSHPISSGRFPGTLNFLVDGQLAKSYSINSSPASITYTYGVAVGTGSHTVTAEVIDSVLYDASDVRTVSMTAPSAASASSGLALVSAKNESTKTRFSWSGGSGTLYAYRSDGTYLCTIMSDRTCPVPIPINTTIYVKDEDGNGETSNTTKVQ